MYYLQVTKHHYRATFTKFFDEQTTKNRKNRKLKKIRFNNYIRLHADDLPF